MLSVHAARLFYCMAVRKFSYCMHFFFPCYISLSVDNGPDWWSGEQSQVGFDEDKFDGALSALFYVISQSSTKNLSSPRKLQGEE